MKLNELNIDDISEKCSHQSQLYRQGRENDPRYCMELFRRAIVQRDEEAWGRVFLQYQEQLYRWVRAHPGFSQCKEDVDHFANAAMTKFWRAISPAKFGDFATLGNLLQYLKMCIGAEILDHLRANQKDRMVERLDDLKGAGVSSGDNLEADLSWQISEGDLWKLILGQMKDEREILVAHHVFLYDMRPRHIFEKYPDQFSGGSKEIYRVLENIMKRLRRNPVLNSWVEGERVSR